MLPYNISRLYIVAFRSKSGGRGECLYGNGFSFFSFLHLILLLFFYLHLLLFFFHFFFLILPLLFSYASYFPFHQHFFFSYKPHFCLHHLLLLPFSFILLHVHLFYSYYPLLSFPSLGTKQISLLTSVYINLYLLRMCCCICSRSCVNCAPIFLIQACLSWPPQCSSSSGLDCEGRYLRLEVVTNGDLDQG
jgi:hypothetical protein